MPPVYKPMAMQGTTGSRVFCVADLDASGTLQLKAEYDYAALQQLPGAADLLGHFGGFLWRSPQEFDAPLLPERRHLSVRWRALAPSAGLLTVRDCDVVASVSTLVCGIDPAADRTTLEAFQNHLVHLLHDSGYEPGFGLMELSQRPLVATVNLSPPKDAVDQHLVALTDRCFAAAYFRVQGLA